VITRNRSNLTVAQAKRHLKKTGWSYRKAADRLGYSYTHIAWVLTGRRISYTVLAAILELPKKQEGK
jgi:transcriptional regulator with XRE-family HTH domain